MFVSWVAVWYWYCVGCKTSMIFGCVWKGTAVDGHINSSKTGMTNIQNWKFLAIDALIITLLSKIWGFQGSEIKDIFFSDVGQCSLVEIQAFQRKLLPSSPGCKRKMETSCPHKFWYWSTKLSGIISQKENINFLCTQHY